MTFKCGPYFENNKRYILWINWGHLWRAYVKKALQEGYCNVKSLLSAVLETILGARKKLLQKTGGFFFKQNEYLGAIKYSLHLKNLFLL